MTRPLLILALLALLAAGCAGQDGDIAVGEGGASEVATTEAGDDPEADDDATADAPSADGTAAPDGPAESLPNPVTGTLDRVDVEGGCTVLVVDGEDYELVAAPGASVAIDPANGVVASTDGDVIAEVGDTITVTGEIDPGLMSFCQVGPILAVEDVTAG